MRRFSDAAERASAVFLLQGHSSLVIDSGLLFPAKEQVDEPPGAFMPLFDQLTVDAVGMLAASDRKSVV